MTAARLCPDDRDYQDIVIGSSPLMLLQAHCLAKKGRRVCVLERSERLGGAWRTVNIGNAIDVEIACHVIEVFPDLVLHRKTTLRLQLKNRRAGELLRDRAHCRHRRARVGFVRSSIGHAIPFRQDKIAVFPNQKSPRNPERFQPRQVLV